VKILAVPGGDAAVLDAKIQSKLSFGQGRTGTLENAESKQHKNESIR
jgi:hypothetical protein